MRVIITGSRHLTTAKARNHLWNRLHDLIEEAGRLTVAHGACRTGIDALASEWCRYFAHLGVSEEKWPADWNLYGVSAGPIRNRAMVLAGADLVLAYPMGSSRGTRGCIQLAVAFHLPVEVYEGDTL